MQAQGHAPVWRTPMGGGRATEAKGWYQRLRDWWTAHQAARREAHLASLHVYWDTEREAVRPLRADAAADMIATQAAFFTTTTLYGLTQ